jgi:hypothetical protein
MTTTVQSGVQTKIIKCVSNIYNETAKSSTTPNDFLQKTETILKSTQKNMGSDFMKYENNFIELQNHFINDIFEDTKNKLKKEGKDQKDIDREVLRLKLHHKKNQRLNKAIQVSV